MAGAHKTPDEERKQDQGGEVSLLVSEAQRHTAPGSFLRTLSDCLIRPTIFFSRLSKGDDRWAALGFALLMHIFGFSLDALWDAIFMPEELTVALIRVVIAPLWVLVSVWIGSELMHGWLKVLRGTTRPRSVTHRVVAFCYSTAILAIVPVVGLRVGFFLAAVYQVIGLWKAHRTKRWKAILAVLLTWVVVGLGLALLFLGSGEFERSFEAEP